MLMNKKYLRATSWPILILMIIQFVYADYWHELVLAEITEPNPWVETGAVEYSTEGAKEGDTQTLSAKAAELSNHPVLIYEFVRNQIKFEPYVGARFGAVGTLDRGRGNDADQTMLLAALLRSAYRNMGEKDPDLRIVIADIEVPAPDALKWFGVDDREGLVNLLRVSGVNGVVTATENWKLVLRDHVWLRGDLEFGPYRGTRFVQGEDGILADMDPSFALTRLIDRKKPSDLMSLDPVFFANQLLAHSQPGQEQPQGYAHRIPESTLLGYIDTAAAQFRRYVETNGLTAETALERRTPSLETIEALPDAPPFRILKHEQFRLSEAPERDDAMAKLRREVQIRVTSPDGTFLGAYQAPSAALYGRAFAIGFEADTIGDDLLESGRIGAAQMPPVRLKILLDGQAVVSSVDIPYGERLNLTFAALDGSSQFSAASRPSPLESSSPLRESFAIVAGGAYSLATVPGLNSATLVDYSNRQIRLSTQTSGGDVMQRRGEESASPRLTAPQALSPTLDVVAQTMLAQTEEFTRLGGLAAGYRASSDFGWALAGMEPQPAADDTFTTPRFIFRSPRETSALAPMSADPTVEDVRLGSILELTREAMIAHAPRQMLGAAVDPVTPGRLIREANRSTLLIDSDEDPFVPIYAVSSRNRDGFEGSVTNDRVPFAPDAAEIKARLDDGDPLVLMPSAGVLAQNQNFPAFGKAWGYLIFEETTSPANSAPHAWRSVLRTPSADSDGPTSGYGAGAETPAFSEQMNEEKLSVAELVYGGRSLRYERLAQATINSLSGYLDAMELSSQAYVAAVNPLVELIGDHGRGYQQATAQGQAKTVGGAVVLLHALLEEFARAEAVSLKLELVKNGAPPAIIRPDQPFNPFRYDTITARGRFSQIVEDYTFTAFDMGNGALGEARGSSLTPPRLDVIEGDWPLKAPDLPQNFFDFVRPPGQTTDINGPFEIRLKGEINDRPTRELVSEFTIDTIPPHVDIIEWQPGQRVSGLLPIRGVASDLHFKSYKVQVAPWSDPQPQIPEWRDLYVSGQEGAAAQALGGKLAEWNTAPAGEEPVNGLFMVRLQAWDFADNTSITMAPVNVRNDIHEPEITIHRPTESELIDGESFHVSVVATDNRPHDVGLSKFKVWVEYSTFHQPIEAPYSYPVTQHNLVLTDQRIETTGTLTASVDTIVEMALFRQISAGPVTLHARAEDHYGHVTSKSLTLNLSPDLFTVQLLHSVLPPTFSDGTDALIQANVFFTNHQKHAGAILYSDDENPEDRDIIGEIPRFPFAFGDHPSVIPISGTQTFSSRFWWNGKLKSLNNERVAHGKYYLGFGQFAEGAQVDAQGYHTDLSQFTLRESFPIRVLPDSNDLKPVSYIHFPQSRVLFKEEVTEYPVTGVAASDYMETRNAAISPTDRSPIQQYLGPDKPYWRLSYKRADVEPVTPDGSISAGYYWGNINLESNWTDIAHGYRQVGDEGSESGHINSDAVMGTLGTWRIANLPEGDYDLRLVTTDGVFYALALARYTITSGGAIPGETVDDRVPGVLKLRHVDLTANFEGFPVEVARTYSSVRANQLGDFGYGWFLDGINLKISNFVSTTESLGERMEAKIKLPDGREFHYANSPPYGAAAGAYNFANDTAWYREKAFVTRPYGQMLWIPGRMDPYLDFLAHPVNALGAPLPSIYLSPEADGPGYAKLLSYLAETGGGSPDGSIALLKLEDGSYIYFKWDTGRILRRQYDSVRKLDYIYDAPPSAPAVAPKYPDFIIRDHAQRQIRIERHNADDGRVSRVVDVLGREITYNYNEQKKELISVRDRKGNYKFFKYEDPYFPHYLTSMIIDRQPPIFPIPLLPAGFPAYSVIDPSDTRIDYAYDTDGRLGRIDTGESRLPGSGPNDGKIVMSYARNQQFVTDLTTGGVTVILHDNAGRVTKQVDPAGVTTEYNYFGDDSKFNGLLKQQTEGGVTTTFDYNTDIYGPRPALGMDEIASQMVDYWLNRYSDGAIVNDYPLGELKPGYLTGAQLQPTDVITPGFKNAVGASTNGGSSVTSVPADDNIVELSYDPNLGNDPTATSPRPDGTGKIYQVTDPEKRVITLSYGGPESPDRNETAGMTGPGGTNVANTYYPAGHANAGRLQTSTTTRETSGSAETLSYTSHEDHINPISAYPDLQAQITAAIAGTSAVLSDLIPGFPGARVEQETVDTGRDADHTSRSLTYRDMSGATLATRDAEGNWSVTLSDAEGRSVLSYQSSNQSRTVNVYDGAGLLTRTIDRDLTDDGKTLITITQYTYDLQGRQTKVERKGPAEAAKLNALPFEITGQTLYTKRSDGARVVTRVDQEKNKSITVTDDAGRTIEERFEGVRGSVRLTKTEYDAHGRRKKVTTPRGLVTEYVYDLAGREVETRESHEDTLQPIITRRGYDEAGRQIWSQTPLQKAAVSTEAPKGRFSAYRYNLNVPSSDPRYGQLLQVFHEDNNIDSSIEDNADYAGYYEAYAYDAKGRQTEITKLTNVRGVNQPVTTRTEYDADGRVEYIIFNYVGDGTPQTTEQNVRFHFTYDTQGVRQSVFYPSGIEKRWDHDELNGRRSRLVESQPGQAGAAPVWKTTLFNENGREDTITDNVGNKIAFLYNQFQLERKTYTLSDLTAAFNHRYAYDDYGRLEEIRTFAGAGDNHLLRAESRKYNPETNRLDSVSNNEGTIDYTFDDSGSLASMSYYGRIVNYEYDFGGRLRRADAPEAGWIWRYNDAGQKVRIENLAKGTIETRTYDSLGRLLGVRHSRQAEAQPIFEIVYTLGVDGNRIGATETRGTEAVTWAYQYDPLGRLTRETRTAASLSRDVSYTYDSDGNRTTETDELLAVTDPSRTKQYFYEPNSHRLDRIERSGIVISEFEWTDNGELESKTEDGQAQSYTWGPDGALRSVESSSGERIEYDYDSSGELIRRREYAASSETPASDRRYLIDSQNLTGYTQRLAEIDAATGAVQILNTFTDEIAAQTLVRASNGSGEQFFHADGLGSIRSLTSREGAEPYDYSGFGSLIRGDRSLTAYAFTGQVADGATGLQNHRARWLNPRIGGWISGDPVWDFPNNFGNFQVYASNNPISIIDLTGAFTLLETLMVSVIAGIIAGTALSVWHSIVTQGQDLSGSFFAFLKGFATAFIITFLLLYAPARQFLLKPLGFGKGYALLTLKMRPLYGLLIATLPAAFTAIQEAEVEYNSEVLGGTNREEVQSSLNLLSNADSYIGSQLVNMLGENKIRYAANTDQLLFPNLFTRGDASSAYAFTPTGKDTIVLFDGFFYLSPEYQAWTLYHEYFHTRQFVQYGEVSYLYPYERESYPYEKQFELGPALGIKYEVGVPLPNDDSNVLWSVITGQKLYETKYADDHRVNAFLNSN